MGVRGTCTIRRVPDLPPASVAGDVVLPRWIWRVLDPGKVIKTWGDNIVDSTLILLTIEITVFNGSASTLVQDVSDFRFAWI